MLGLARYVLAFLAVTGIGVKSEEERGFSKPLSLLMMTRNNMAHKIKSMLGDVDNPPALKSFVQILKDLKPQVKNFIDASLTDSDSRTNIEMLKNTIIQDRSFTDEESLYKSYTLKLDKTKRLGMLWNTMLIKINQLLSSGKDNSIIDMSKVCQGLPRSFLHSVKKELTKEITVLDVCTGLSACGTVSKPYYWKNFDHPLLRRRRIIYFPEWKKEEHNNPYRYPPGYNGLPYFTEAPTKPKPKPDPRFEQDILSACTANGRCNVEKALPMMTGILWYKISELILQRLCSQGCLGQYYNFADLYKNVITEIDLVISYATTLDKYWKSIWQPFFTEGLTRNAYTKLDVALSMVNDKKEDFMGVGKLCRSFDFEKACPISALYNQYILIKKIQRKRTEGSKIKDLRLLDNVNLKEMITLQQEEARHVELLGTLKKLDENLKASVAGISDYFQGIAKYDQGIANADMAFIQQELIKYETSLAVVEGSLTKDLREAMSKMEIVLGANVAEQAAILVVVLAANSNPLKLVFNGPDIKDTMEQSGKLANAASQLKKGLALISALDDLTQDSLKLQTAFNGNKNQIAILNKVVTQVRNGNAASLGADADTFIEQYGAYTPKTDRSQLNRNSALWQSFKDATCDLLNGEVGVGGSVTQSQAGSKLLCEKMEGTLAQFTTLREDIFDFQFQLVDAIAATVRGQIAQKLAENIKGNNDLIHASELMTGFFMVQNKVQTVCSVYCDRLEYLLFEERLPACSTSDGLFRKGNIDNLRTYKDNNAYDIDTRHVYIPTKSLYKEHPNSIIDLPALARGEKVFFKIPADITWLREHRWMNPEDQKIPFLQSFKLYLPKREYKKGASLTHTLTTVKMTSVGGSIVSLDKGDSYLLPKDQATFRTAYEEGYRSCPGTEKKNPYNLCNNLPKLCDTSHREPGESLLPTVVSSWAIQQFISERGPIPWDAPSPATNLLLHAEVVLKLPSKSLKSNKGLTAQRDSIEYTEDGCCKTGNRYRSSLYTRICSVCPKGSNSFHGGLYCEIEKPSSVKK